MPRLDITLNGHTYAVSCEEGQEARLREIAAFVDVKLKNIAQLKPTANETQLFVLTALLLADQVFDLKAEQAKTAPSQAAASQPTPVADKTEAALRREIRAELEGKYAAQIEALTKRVESVASSLASV